MRLFRSNTIYCDLSYCFCTIYCIHRNNAPSEENVNNNLFCVLPCRLKIHVFQKHLVSFFIDQRLRSHNSSGFKAFHKAFCSTHSLIPYLRCQSIVSQPFRLFSYTFSVRFLLKYAKQKAKNIWFKLTHHIIRKHRLEHQLASLFFNTSLKKCFKAAQIHIKHLWLVKAG